MVLVKVLKRKDASSVVVAVAVGLIIFSFLSTVTGPLAAEISSINPQQVGEWRNQYLLPFVAAVLQLIFLEVLGWIYVWAAGSMKKK